MIRNSVKISYCNKSLCFKVLFFRIIVYAIAFLICYFLAKATILPIIKSDEAVDVVDTLRLFVYKFFSSNPDDVEFAITSVNTELNESLAAFLKLIKSQAGGIIGSAIGVMVTLLVITFVLGVVDYAVGVLINNHMSSMRHASFFSAMFENFSNACKYGIYRLIALFVYNVVTYAIIISLGVLLFYLIDFFALPIIVLLLVLAIVNRQALAGQTLPNMICGGETPWQAFKSNFKNVKKSELCERYMSYFILCVSTFAITVLSGIATFYVALLLTIPFSAVVFSTIKFVDYYQRNNKKYYITYDDIVIPKNLRDNDENLLNKVDLY